jgi:broad specificity phosphatase PhoE
VIALVRHGETEPNRAGVLLGRADPPLTTAGQSQATALARCFEAGPRPQAVVTSPLRRAVDTAAAIAESWDLDVEIDERLVEMDYGEWDEIGFGDVPRAELERWRNDPYYAPPGGESLAEVQDRVTTCAAELFARAADNLVIAVSHVSPIKAVVAWTLNVGPEIAWRLRLDVASITRVTVGPGATPILLTYNERLRDVDV